MTRTYCDYAKLAKVFDSMAPNGVTIRMVVDKGYTKDQVNRHIQRNPTLVSAKVNGVNPRYFFSNEEAKQRFFEALGKPAPASGKTTQQRNSMARPIHVSKIPASVTFAKDAQIVYPPNVKITSSSNFTAPDYKPKPGVPVREGSLDFLSIRSRGLGHDSSPT